MCSKSGVGLTMSCSSDGGFVELLPAGMCTGLTRKRGLTGMSLFCGGGGTNVGMGVGGLRYKMFLVGCADGLEVVGRLAFLFLFNGGGEADISGSVGLKSVSGGSLLSGEEGVSRKGKCVSNICLDSVSKQMPASKYGWGIGKIFSLVLQSNRG